jgi:N-acetylneuraminic acid mutarotase
LLAVGVIDGTLYAVGGSGANRVSLNVVEAYDPTTDTWTTKQPLPEARQDSSGSVLGRKLYIFGGDNKRNHIVGTTFAYDSSTNRWASTLPMPTKRNSLASRNVNGIIYAIGGYNGTELNTVEAFNPR